RDSTCWIIIATPHLRVRRHGIISQIVEPEQYDHSQCQTLGRAHAPVIERGQQQKKEQYPGIAEMTVLARDVGSPKIHCDECNHVHQGDGYEQNDHISVARVTKSTPRPYHE